MPVVRNVVVDEDVWSVEEKKGGRLFIYEIVKVVAGG
jgi:hypothetical protein